jgi:prepilin-type N-terminal cleavage/methylation domain-containing protein
VVIKQRGFSLIEVLMVVLIISIITAVCMPGYVRFVQKSRVIKILLPVLRTMEQNVAIFYLSSKELPGEEEFPIIAGEEYFGNMQVSLAAGEISITIDAPGLTDKVHLFDGQEILATPEIRDGHLRMFRLSGDLAVALGFK